MKKQSELKKENASDATRKDIFLDSVLRKELRKHPQAHPLPRMMPLLPPPP